MRPVPRPAAIAATLILASAVSGCVYRMDIQQGNLLDAEQVDQVEVGMTRSHVYSLRRGHEREVTKRHLVVWFDGDKVTRVEEPIPLPRGSVSSG
jgi:hypothetical protein